MLHVPTVREQRDFALTLNFESFFIFPHTLATKINFILWSRRARIIVLPIPFATIHLSDKSSLDEVKADFSGFVPIIRRKSPKTIVTTGTLIGILLSCACRSEIFLGFR